MGFSDLFTLLFYEYKYNCKRSGTKFSLPFEFFSEIIVQNCYYCGSKPSLTTRKRSKEHSYTNGLDRKVSELDYTPDNVVSCCRDCNFAKQTLSRDEFIKLVRNIYENTKDY